MNTFEYLKITMDKIKEKTIIDKDTNCWLFTGAKDGDGYGMICFDISPITKSHMIRVHRLSAHFFLFLDLDDKQQQANHINECPNKNCWNPAHLYIGNNHQNILDSVQKGTHYIPKFTPLKGRHIGTHCSRGHELNESNLYVRKNGSWLCKECAKLLRVRSKLV